MQFEIAKVGCWPIYPLYVTVTNTVTEGLFFFNFKLLIYSLGDPIFLTGGALRKAGGKAPVSMLKKALSPCLGTVDHW